MLHWASLNQCQLGALGWWSHQKKDSLTKCMVDLQKFNAVTMRETHHTSSPFNQASKVPAYTRNTQGKLSWPSLLPSCTWCNYIHQWMGQILIPSGLTWILRIRRCIYSSIWLYNHWYRQKKKTKKHNALMIAYSIEASFWHTMDYITHCSNNSIVWPREISLHRKGGGFRQVPYNRGWDKTH